MYGKRLAQSIPVYSSRSHYSCPYPQLITAPEYPKGPHGISLVACSSVQRHVLVSYCPPPCPPPFCLENSVQSPRFLQIHKGTCPSAHCHGKRVRTQSSLISCSNSIKLVKNYDVPRETGGGMQALAPHQGGYEKYQIGPSVPLAFSLESRPGAISPWGVEVRL
ncbi:unnamed protein product, partial [Ectocarpus sp. 12 AP-2014]